MSLHNSNYIPYMLFIRTRLLYLGALLFCIWPVTLHAYPVEKMPRVLVPSSSFLLVANQQMTDPRFRKTVLLVTRHGKSGPLGIILNRKQNMTLDSIFPNNPSASKFNLFTGGPVYPQQISYLVRGSEAVAGSLTISSDVYLAYDMTVLDELLTGKRSYSGLRVVHGMASWAPGQLENEISRGGWFVMPLDIELIFDSPPEDMWQELQRRSKSPAR